jgi:hypothetical protein
MSKARGLADLGNVYDDGALSNRNMVVNGGMTVAQRAVSVTGVTGQAYHCCDRFQSVINALGTWTVTQEADGPSGFANSLKYECTTADASPAAGDYIFITQSLEGLNVQQIAKGTADAKPLTLSFWVKSNVTGTYCVYLLDKDNSRGVGGTYSVSVSGTWEYKTISIPADTTGVFDNDNNNSLQVEFWLDSGTDFTSGTTPSAWEAQDNTDRNGSSTVNLGDTIGNYWQITGVQLEVGDTATPFEHRSFGDELARCQRYYERMTFAQSDYTPIVCYNESTSNARGSLQYMVTKRADPTFSATSSAFVAVSTGSTGTPVSITSDHQTVTNARVQITNSNSTLVDGGASHIQMIISSGQISLDAEL